MQKNVYSVLDTKAATFCNPFFSLNHQTALRDFYNAAQDPGTMICKNPEDYCLYHIGSFDDETGKIMPVQAIENLGLAILFREV